MSDLRFLAPTAEIKEENLSMEHMRAVDGWTVYPEISSPPPTPSLGLGGTSSQVDELFPPSPPAGPGDSVSILELESLKMGEVQIPRQSRVGHIDENLLRRPQSLASLLPQHHISFVDLGTNKEEPRPLEYADDATIASSMLGQPPSRFDADDDKGESRADEDDLEAELRAIWSKAGCDVFEIILQDGIDESKALLFEVPALPPPTVHKPWEQLPGNLTLLVSSLEIVKGIRPLNLELSWVPFKYGNKVPTNEEVSRVSEGILDDLTILVDQDPRERDEVRRLLIDLISPTPPELVSNLAFEECTHPDDFTVTEILYNDSIRPHQLVLTRDERHRISRTGAGLSGLLAPDPPQHIQVPVGEDTDMTPGFDGGGSLFEELEFNSQIPQRNFAELEYLEPKDREGECEEEFVAAPAKRRRLGDLSPVVDSPAESSLEVPDSDTARHIIPQVVESILPGRMETLNGTHLPRFPLAPQNTHVLPDATSHPRDSVRPNLPDTIHLIAPPAIVRDIEPGHASATERRQELVEFLALRGVRLNEPPATTITEAAKDNPQIIETLPVPQPSRTEIPSDLIDKNTIQLPPATSLPVSRHQYLASLDLLQKHALCRCLSDGLAAIDLIEREFLGGVDLILDQDTAILFLPLSALPSECEGLIAGISDISWRYSYILVIFEAFLVSQAFGDGEENLIASFAFTEPILKSVKKLKRSLAIAEGVGTKTEDCLVSWAFSKNIEEAARLARVYGDIAESRDKTGGLLWQERWWLGEREAEDSPLSEFEDEGDLAMVAGMNAFAACLILSQMSSDQFLSLTSQGRTEMFGQLLGTKRMAELNRFLERSAVALSSSLPTSDLRDSSSTPL
ncbi:hypothetical protein BDM02DRAFT_459593 [Thelephora ganbajun]|uniref:Uncharacterized protein n=1 Tax=Thelephora ganbajun TaxID=370292 RepID=A0ACB6ZS38_THEGA|nr:hypothetical protein BDM02DRAFT_459593 [Thelephora ganbajun]